MEDPLSGVMVDGAGYGWSQWRRLPRGCCVPGAFDLAVMDGFVFVWSGLVLFQCQANSLMTPSEFLRIPVFFEVVFFFATGHVGWTIGTGLLDFAVQAGISS
jgi:hypothetical protein